MRIIPLEVILLLWIALASPVHSTPSPPTFPLITSLMDWEFRNISSWSGGGGDKTNITGDSGHPFAGRQFGGADRSSMRGTRAFGSGYAYGNTSASTIAGRPFPFGTWPLWWGQNFMGSDEYGPGLDTVRPGGLLVVQAVTTTKEKWDDFTTEEMSSYYIVTDRDTNLAIMTSIVTWCRATPMWPTVFEPETSPVKMENVIQYYRASSFALAYKGYNNTFARNPNSEASMEESTPVPDVVKNSQFIQCVDGVIMDALPIVDGPPVPENNIPTILGIVFGIFGIPIIVCLWFLLAFCFSLCRRR